MKSFLLLCLVSSAIGQVVPSGADPTGVQDSYPAIQSAINTAVATHQELDIPAGTFSVSQGLTSTSSSFRMRCAGAAASSITLTTPGYNTLSIGPGSTGGTVTANGYLRDCTIKGSGNAHDGHSALQLNGAIQYEVDSVTVDNADIGIDPINNNYGSQFTNIRGGFAGDLNVGVNLRTATQSGSDLSFYNPWVFGRIAAFYIAGGGGGYHFYGGQLGAGAGTASPSDTSAAVVLGKDYLTGAIGETSADFHGTSFEGTNFAWVFRSFGQVNLSLFGISANPSGSAAPAIGFYKGETLQNSHIYLNAVAVSGYWSNAQLVVGSGAWPAIWWIEQGTYTAANNPWISGQQTYIVSLAAQSGIQANAYYVGSTGPVSQGKALQ